MVRLPRFLFRWLWLFWFAEKVSKSPRDPTGGFLLSETYRVRNLLHRRWLGAENMNTKIHWCSTPYSVGKWSLEEWRDVDMEGQEKVKTRPITAEPKKCMRSSYERHKHTWMDCVVGDGMLYRWYVLHMICMICIGEWRTVNSEQWTHEETP